METVILCGVIVLLLIIHAIERRDLYNRIMSSDINDYKNYRSRDKPKKIYSRHEEVMRAWRKRKRSDD